LEPRYLTSEIKNLIHLKKPANKTRMFQTLLKGRAMSYFEHYLRRSLDTEYSKIIDNDFIELLIWDEGKEFIPERTVSMQKYYMR
jgi:hypothetical protein